MSKNLIFKGGTCATLLGYLDRFSVDLDFDQAKSSSKLEIKKRLEDIFKKLDLVIKDQSTKTIQYRLKYSSTPSQRNTLKLDVVSQNIKADVFAPQYLTDIDRYMTCQTIETMFAHKLVAITDRFAKHNSIAGRDVYDLRHFFLQGYSYHPKIVVERTNKSPKTYLMELKDFISKNVTQTIIDQDINTLLTPNQFQKIRKVIKSELLVLISEHLQTL